jgi:hypothetical protein
LAIRQNQNTNLASEFFIASQLYRLGYTPTITLGHTKEIDLIVAHPDGRTVTIDVKGLKNKTNWPLKPKLISPHHFYVLVCYLEKYQNIAVPPEVFVIPSTRIESLLGKWTGLPQVTAVGYNRVRNGEFKDAWHLLFAK